MYDDDLEGYKVVGGKLVELEFGEERYYEDIEREAKEHVPFYEEGETP